MLNENSFLKKKPTILQKPSFARAAKRGAKQFEAFKAEELPNEEDLPLVIQGTTVGSKNEARVAVALDFLKQQYVYQYPVNYGRQRAGGQVIDFLLVPVRPLMVLDVKGVYWHTGIHEDALSIEKVVRQKGWRYVEISDAESKTIDQTISILRSRLPHG